MTEEAKFEGIRKVPLPKEKIDVKKALAEAIATYEQRKAERERREQADSAGSKGKEGNSKKQPKSSQGRS
jgi:hypothetical protein